MTIRHKTADHLAALRDLITRAVGDAEATCRATWAGGDHPSYNGSTPADNAVEWVIEDVVEQLLTWAEDEDNGCSARVIKRLRELRCAVEG